MHPRRARLGLLEAENAMQQSVIDPMHPRRARLGLIEARPFLAALSFARVCIRGARASASLKPDHWLGGRGEEWSIRGARASASLKLRAAFSAALRAAASEARAPRPH